MLDQLCSPLRFAEMTANFHARGHVTLKQFRGKNALTEIKILYKVLAEIFIIKKESSKINLPLMNFAFSVIILRKFVHDKGK